MGINQADLWALKLLITDERVGRRPDLARRMDAFVRHTYSKYSVQGTIRVNTKVDFSISRNRNFMRN
jgi:hypothetical protein